MAYSFLSWVFTTALTLFYRWRHLGGAIPAKGPVVIVGNHPNGLIDPIAVMRLTGRPLRFLAKAPIFKMPVLGSLVRALHALPVHRKQDDAAQMGKNEETFQAAHHALADGDAIGIFPEGKSHSEPHLEPLKTGAARIALGAEAEKGYGLGVQIIPVGFIYVEKGILRSEAAVEVGEPIPASIAFEAFRKDPQEGSHVLTQAIDEALRRLTVNLESWEDLPLVELARAVYRAEFGSDVTLRPFAEGLKKLRVEQPDALAQARSRALAFGQALRSLRLRADELDQVTAATAARWVLQRLVAAVVLAPLAVLGMVAYLVPYQAIKAFIQATHPEEDMEATLKLGVSIFAFPLWTAALAGLAGHFLGWESGLALLAALPLCGLLAMFLIERGPDEWSATRAYLLLGSHGAARTRLLARRKALAAEIAALGALAGLSEGAVGVGSAVEMK
jgi:1-acyl-sn-glycerol-3-phosphate acyltransferase